LCAIINSVIHPRTKEERREERINPEGRYDDEKMAEKQEYEQPEKRDLMTDINPEGKHNEEKTVGKQPYEQQAESDPGEHLVERDELLLRTQAREL
jgi:hypothetical protein